LKIQKFGNWSLHLIQGICYLVLCACEFPSALQRGKNGSQDSFEQEEALPQAETETALEVRLEQLPPKSRALILNRLAGQSGSLLLADEEEAQEETQHVFIGQLLEMLRLEGRADRQAVASLKELAIHLAHTGELEKYATDSNDVYGRWWGIEGWGGKRVSPSVSAGVQALDVATCLFQVSDQLLLP
jgi:hypothetical protein